MVTGVATAGDDGEVGCVCSPPIGLGVVGVVGAGVVGVVGAIGFTAGVVPIGAGICNEYWLVD